MDEEETEGWQMGTRLQEDRRPLYMQLRDKLRTELLSGMPAPGGRLPSARELAKQEHISRNTVDEAYRMLEEEGLVRIVAGQGTFATQSRDNAKEKDGNPFDWERHISREARDGAMFREREGYVDLGNRKVISFSSLAPDYHTFESEAFRRALNTVLVREGPVLLAYGYTRGYEPFRQYIKETLIGKGLKMEGQEVLIVSGFRQGAGIVVASLVNAGECVAVEAPTYNGFLGLLKARGAVPVPIPCDTEGMLPDKLEQAILEKNIRLTYLIPTYHNPTGRNMSMKRRREILDLCGKYEVPILEDGFNEELRFRGENHPAMKALSGSEPVVYAGSFSKVLFPGLRVGWVVAPKELYRYLLHEKYLEDIHTPVLLQAALMEYCKTGNLDKHIRRIRILYRERLDALYAALEKYFTGRAKWEKVEGGFSVWVEFPEGLDMRANMEKAKDFGVLYAPGDAFYPDGRGRNCIRLGFSRLTPEKITEGVRLLSDFVRTLGG